MKTLSILTLLLILLPAPQAPTIQAPTLKWQHGGCYTSWCETGWYSSPAVADLDGDGTMEVIGASYTLYALNGEDGSKQWSVDPESGRVWPGVVLADLDNDGDLEIVTAHGNGYLHVFDTSGNEVWSQRPTSNELRGLSVYDLDDDGTLEIIVTGAVYNKTNTWVYEHDGTLRSGWPQLSNDSGYAYGIFNDNAAVGDLDGDGQGEIVIPSDVHYICAYEANGTQIPANSMYGDKDWGKVGVWESPAIELRGWGECDGNRTESYRTNFAHGPALIADVNGDGAAEVIAVGNVYDCNVGHPPGKYNGVYIFNADRSRFNTGGFDWRNPPVDTGAPLSEDYSEIENAQPNPAVADLDGDGNLEIVFASYDGRMHAFWLDKTEHGAWPYSVYNASEGFYRFASEPVIADLDNDGHAEVIFTSWTQKGSHHTGKLHIVDYLGHALQELDLPAAFGDSDWNGALAAPTLANLDNDTDLEIVVNTAHSGFVAYDLPSTANARVLWATGRGNYQRSGTLLLGNLDRSTLNVTPSSARTGDPLSYTLRLENPGPTLPGVWVTITLPVDLHYRGDLTASSGQTGIASNIITWTGNVLAATPVTVSWSVTVGATAIQPQALRTTAIINDQTHPPLSRTATVIVNGYPVYLPVIYRM